MIRWLIRIALMYAATRFAREYLGDQKSRQAPRRPRPRKTAG